MKNLTELTVPAFRYTMMSIYYTVREMFLFGSRKSAKTKHIALRIILRAMSDREYNALCMRKASVWISESIQEELQWAIYWLGVEHLWVFHQTKREYTYLPFKNKVKLRGISINPTSTKPTMSGLIVSVGWIKDVWMEEAWEFSEDDYKMIRQTIRGGSYTLIITGNPYFQSIWCVKKAIELFPPVLDTLKKKGEMWKYLRPKRDSQTKKMTRLESIVHWSNFQINDKLSQEDIDERWEEETRNPKDFLVVGYGYPGSPSGTILGDLTDNIQERDINYFIQRATEYAGGVDVGVEYDATACTFGGMTPDGEIIIAEGYWHNNGLAECNNYSDGGVWRKKNPHELATDVVNYFWRFKDIWERKHPTDFVINVDNADSSFISILNRDLENRGITQMRFIATRGTKYDKQRIERRIIFERQTLSRKKMNFLVLRDQQGKIISYPTRLRYEMENIPWKRILETGEVRLERDGTKVHPDMTNAWEYLFRRWMPRIMRSL